MTIVQKRSQLHTFFVLGRVSNLPTVWTNILAACLFALAVSSPAEMSTYSTENNRVSLYWLALLLGLSCMYLGGMFLNDAWDADWDKHHQVARPIPLGHIKRNSVYLWSFLLLGMGVSLLGGFSLIYMTSIVGVIAVSLLLLIIILYDLFHKPVAWSRFLMGGCRAGVYLVSALFVTGLNSEIIWVAIIFGCYISGVTLLAQFESISSEQGKQYPLFWLNLALVMLCSPLLLISFMPINLFFLVVLIGFYTVLIRKLWSLLKSITLQVNFLFSLFLDSFQIIEMKKQAPQNTQEDIKPNQIGTLLGAIPLFDALVLASVEQWLACFLCLCVYLASPILHRWVSPT